MESILPHLQTEAVQHLLPHINTLTFNAVPEEYQDEETQRYYTVYVEYRSPGLYCIRTERGIFYNAQFEESRESLPSTRTDEYKQQYRFPLLQAVELAEELANRVLFQGLSIQDIINYKGLFNAHQNIPPSERIKRHIL